MRILIAAFCLIAIGAQAQTLERFYDNNGNYRGRLERSGSRDYILDQNGNRHGYYERQGDRLYRYDNNGNPRGYQEDRR